MNNIEGKWDVTVHTFLGDQFSVHEFKINGNELKGNVTDKGNGAQSEIVEGTVDGENFEYQFSIKIPIGKLRFRMKGELLADGTIKGISKNAMGKFEFVGKRI